MNQRVTIAVGFAAGLEGEVVRTFPDDGYAVLVTYPEGFTEGANDLSGSTDRLFYRHNELKFHEES